ncbi:50S ribosomal protein L10 [Fodinicurvata sp. EGI_FJ10296]|uniref:50S ribosomal protein L10 n=1 Tax=Fodinicurvata sp. EGI_FJ10296 TaxID=3231908 RepID=UPI00345721A4
MRRPQKEEKVAALHEAFGAAHLVVVTHQTGLTVAEVTALRGQMREAGASFTVTKNRLAKIALDGTPFEHLADLFNGPTAIAVSSDPVAAARVAVGYSEKNTKLKVLGGAMGSQKLNADEIIALAKLPSLDELRGKIVGVIQTPATRIAGVLQAPGGQMARVLKAYADKDQAA